MNEKSSKIKHSNQSRAILQGTITLNKAAGQKQNNETLHKFNELEHLNNDGNAISKQQGTRYFYSSNLELKSFKKK